MKTVSYQIRNKTTKKFLEGMYYNWASRRHIPRWRDYGHEWKRLETVTRKYIKLVQDYPELEENIEVIKNDIKVVQSVEPIEDFIGVQWKGLVLTGNFNKKIAETIINGLDGDLKNQKYIMVFKKLSIRQLHEIRNTLIKAGVSKKDFVLKKCSPYHAKVIAFKNKEDLILVTLQYVSNQSIVVYEVDDLKNLPIKDFRKKYQNV